MTDSRSRGGHPWSRILPWAGLLVGGALLAWVLRGLDWPRFFDALSAANWWMLWVLPVANLVQVSLRAEKWRHLLHPLARIGWPRLFGAIMGGYFADMVIPVRVGPLVRAWLVARLERMPTGSLLATVALDRTIDGLIFIALAGLALLWWRFPGQEQAIWQGLATGVAVSGGLLVAAALLLLALNRGMLPRLKSAAPWLTFRFLPSRWRAAAGRFADAFADGVVWPAQPWRGAVVIGAGLLMKLVAVSYFFWATLAFDVSLRPEDYLFLMVFLGFLLFVAGMLKIVGGFTAGAVFALGLLGIEVETALAMTLVVQASTYATVGLAGGVALWVQGVSIGALRGSRLERSDDG